MTALTAISGSGPAFSSFKPSGVRYIKLGAGGAWEHAALEQRTLEWGTDTDPHGLAEEGDWIAVNEHYRALGFPRSTATAYTREAHDFYTTGADTLWITFSGGYLWWSFAAPGVTDRGAGRTSTQAARFRGVPGGWRNTDLLGSELRITDLSTKLTQLSAYRQSICSVAATDYLLRRIRGEDAPEREAAVTAKTALAAALLPIIQQLHQSDFELFTDLLFGAMGWRRRSTLGGTMKDIDLLLDLPATGEQAVVQVKSKADAKLVQQCGAAMRRGWPTARAYIVYHTGLAADAAQQLDGTHIVDGPALAAAAIDHGLTNWLLTKA